MALVAYEYSSDDSDGETESRSLPERFTFESTANNFLHDREPPTIFNSLPAAVKPQLKLTEHESENAIPKTKIPPSTEKVKIMVPSLSEFGDLKNDLNESKIVSKTLRGSGLLSLLPSPKSKPLSNTTFVPNTVSQKQKIKPLRDSSTNKEVLEVELKTRLNLQNNTKDKDNDGETDSDSELPDSFDDKMWEKLCGRPKKENIEVIDNRVSESVETTINLAPKASEPYNGLGNAAFKELVGKTKRPLTNIKLIDINESDIVAEKDLWMTKSITDPEYIPKAVIENPVDPTRKRKHHITYLAEQAKANEQDLKNQWAANKNARLQTRSKYGF